MLKPLIPIILLALPACAATSNDARPAPSPKVATFLMFQENNAEEAVRFYTSLIDGSEIIEIQRFGPGEQGAEGTVKLAAFTLAGARCLAFDSPPVHNFTFTPSISLFVECESEAELDRLYTALVEGGVTMMPPDDYGFSRKHAWLADRFGVSWQLSLPYEDVRTRRAGRPD